MQPLLIDSLLFRVSAGAILRRHGVLVALSGIAIALFAMILWRCCRSFPASEVRDALNTRAGAGCVLALVAFWSAPMMLGGGKLLNDDWAPQLRAAVLATESLSQGSIPTYAFSYSNGASFSLQYPPLATFGPALVSYVTGLGSESAIKILAFFLHLVFLIGGYRLFRGFGFSSFAGYTGISAIGLSQQYLLSGFSFGAIPSYVPFALLPAILHTVHRTLVTGSRLTALLAGTLLGSCVLAHPVSALFTAVYVCMGFFAFTVFTRTPLVLCAKRVMPAILVATLVAAPYVTSVIYFSRYNPYSPGQVRAFQFPPLNVRRAFIWNPHAGFPPGIGTDKGGYFGLVLLASNAAWIACAAAYGWRGRHGGSNGGETARRALPYLLALGLGLFLVYGSHLPGYQQIPFIHLAKGTYRLFPFLAIPLAFGLALAAEFAFTRLPAAIPLLVLCLIVMEDAPFSLRPAYLEVDEAQLQPVVAGLRLTADDCLMLMPSDEQTPYTLFSVFYRWESLARVRDIYYVHHEDLGMIGKRYWPLRLRLQNIGQLDIQEVGRLRDELRFLRVTKLVVVGHPTDSLARIGPLRNGAALGSKYTIVDLAGPVMRRRLTTATIQVPHAPTVAPTPVILPVSYLPQIEARTRHARLATASTDGLLSVCCIDSRDADIQLEFVTPPWLSILYMVSSASLVSVAIAVFSGAAVGALSKARRAAVERAWPRKCARS